jgi:hypothetical protein
VVTIGTDLPAFAGPEVEVAGSAEAAVEVLARILGARRSLGPPTA